MRRWCFGGRNSRAAPFALFSVAQVGIMAVWIESAGVKLRALSDRTESFDRSEFARLSDPVGSDGARANVIRSRECDALAPM
jgi:hypothetical protein